MQLESRKTAWGKFYAQKLPKKAPQRNWALSQQNWHSKQQQSCGNQPYRHQQPLRNWNGPRKQQPFGLSNLQQNQQNQPYQQRPHQQTSQQQQEPAQRRIEAPPNPRNWGPKLNSQYNQQNAYYGNANEDEDDLQAGLIIGLGQLVARDAVLHLKRRVITVGEKEVKLTYTGSAESNVIPLMHIGISKPTFIVHEERQEKWAALRDSMAQAKRITSH
ncbi:MAG: hypothetical protein Q9184_007762, partial [Pyrenodesmia sp. 2 TL-2023]